MASVALTVEVDAPTQLQLNLKDVARIRLAPGNFAGILVRKHGANSYLGYVFEATTRHGVQVLPLGDRTILRLAPGSYQVEALGHLSRSLGLHVVQGGIRVVDRTQVRPVHYWGRGGSTKSVGDWYQPLPDYPRGGIVLATLAVYGPSPTVVDAAFCIRPKKQPPCSVQRDGQLYWIVGGTEIRLIAGGRADRIIDSAYSGGVASPLATDGDWGVLVLEKPR